MQDPVNGNMLELSETETRKRILELTQKEPDTVIDPTKVYDVDSVSNYLESKGYTVLRVNEPLEIKSCKFKVYGFKNKRLVLETDEDIASFKINVGEKFTIKGGNFIVESYGKSIMNLRGLPSTKFFSGHILDAEKVKEDRKKAKKELKEAKNINK